MTLRCREVPPKVAKSIRVVYWLQCTCQVCGRPVYFRSLDELPAKCPQCQSPNWLTGPKYRWSKWRREKEKARRGQFMKIPPMEITGGEGAGN